MITLLDPAEIVDQLKAQCPLFENRVYHSVEEPEHDVAGLNWPFALVYLSSDASDPNDRFGMHHQTHHNVIAVKIGLRKTASSADRLNSANADTLRDCRIEVLNALVGFGTSLAETSLDHLNGELQKTQDYLYWIDKFTNDDFLRK